jgi:hypothetical protein
MSPIPGKLVFTWKINSDGRTRSEDLVYAAAYNPKTKLWIYGLNLVKRDLGIATSEFAGLSNKSLHAYIGVLSPDGRTASNSMYLGEVSVR